MDQHLPESDSDGRADPSEQLAPTPFETGQPGSNPPHYYEAKYHSIENFDIVSYDPQLNSNG